MRRRRFVYALAGLALAATLGAQDADDASSTSGAEGTFSFSLDAGARFRHTFRGDEATYRSLVNLGEGPKLLGLEAIWEDPGSKMFSRATVSAGGWGGDPYNTLRVGLEGGRSWRLTADYRNMSYYNFLPSFANPFQERGGLSQRTYDLDRRYSNVELELLPTWLVSPYLVYTRDSGEGTGVSLLVVNANEYVMRSNLRDSTSHYRGGVRIGARRWHLTLEQGASAFKDDQSNSSPGLSQVGNRLAPFLGQQLYLSGGAQAYAVRGRNLYSKALLTASPASWVDVALQFQHSRPTTEARYHAAGEGLLYLGGTSFGNGFDTLLDSEAKMPRSSGSVSVEVRPLRRVRIVETWTTDRYHNAASALLAEHALFAGALPQVATSFSASRLELDYNRQQVMALVDLPGRITLRGGHRYVWGKAAVPPHFLSPDTPGTGELKQHVALAGLSWRPAATITANIDYEASPGDQQYFRTSLHDYKRLRVRARWQALPSLAIGGSYQFLDNENPQAGSDYQLESRSLAATIEWRPAGGRRISLVGEYGRSTLRSDIEYLVPQILQPARSNYQENPRTVTGLLQVHLPGSGAVQPYLRMGGSLFVSSGTRPANYWQPLGSLHLPVHRNVEAYGEWRWYGLRQTGQLFEGFRTHQFAGGLRWTM